MNRNTEDEAAAGAAARERCSEATLRGTYLVAYAGVDISGNDQVPFAGAGYEVFDGNGNVNTVFSANFNGTVISPPQSLSGTYTVNADCTGTSTYTFEGVTSHYDLFIAPDGSMLTWVQTDPPEFVVSAVEQRVRARRDGD
jgi:hypothetical protein